MEQRIGGLEQQMVEVGKVLAVTVEQTRRNTENMKDIISSIKEDRRGLLSAVQALQQERAVCQQALKVVNKRLDIIESSQRWVVRGILGSLGTLLVGLVALVIKLVVEGKL